MPAMSSAGSSGEALLLDMNPRFDAAHLYSSAGFIDANHDGVQNTAKSATGFNDTNHNGVKLTS